MKKVVISIVAMTMATPLLADSSEIEKRFRKLYPHTKVTSVRESPVKGVYEVVMGRNVAYTDETARYVIFGHLYDMEEQRNLTAEVQKELNKVDVTVIPQADAIKVVRGKGERVIYVFSDPDCPYCKQLEKELAKVDNITIYTILYPITSLHPDAHKKSVAIWCAKDRVKAWNDFMQKGALPQSRTCDNPIDRNIRLGESFGINGTPTIILGSGRIIPGAVPATELERILSGGE